jgi:hypothetical protein
MATLSTYYLNGISLSSSTTIFSDATLTVIAPDGFYSDGVISREQVSGVLLPAVVCGSCTTPCGGAISSSGSQGVYLLNLDAGSTISDVGAIIIKFDPFGIPDGIKVTFNGNVYNKISSPVDGYHQSTDPNGFTVIGNSSNDCGLTGNVSNFPALQEFVFSGTSFVSTGSTQNITINPGDVSLGATQPGNSVMVIPKTTATPSLVNIVMVGPCGGTAFNISVNCPVLLPSFLGSAEYGSANIPCDEPIDQTYYFAKVHTAIDSFVGLYDYVFVDAFGAVALADGFYLIDNVDVPNKVIEVVNGIVVALTNCLSPVVTATFDTDGGDQTYANQTGAAPLSVTSPGTPTKSGNTFLGWSPSLPTTITVNTTFVAQWDPTPVTTFNSVLAVDDCNDQTGIATTITDINDVDVIVGAQLVSTSGGNLTPLAAGVYRMSIGLIDGDTYNLGSITVSNYIVQVDNSGNITNITQC